MISYRILLYSYHIRVSWVQRNKSIHINVQSNFIIPLKQTAINFLKPNFIFRSGRVPDLISLYVGMVKFFLFGIFFVICLLWKWTLVIGSINRLSGLEMGIYCFVWVINALGSVTDVWADFFDRKIFGSNILRKIRERLIRLVFKSLVLNELLMLVYLPECNWLFISIDVFEIDRNES